MVKWKLPLLERGMGVGGRGGTGRNTRMIEEIWKIGIDGIQVDWKWISATH